MGGCLPRVAGSHKATTLAQMEVSAGKVARLQTPIGEPVPKI
jgi:hypothetical protein